MNESRTTTPHGPVSATLDGLRTITIRYPRPVRLPVLSDVVVRDQTGQQLAVSDIAPARPTSKERAKAFRLHLEQPPSLLRQNLEIQVAESAPLRVLLGRVLSNKRFHDAEARLGATYSHEAALFGLFSPNADAAEVVIAAGSTGAPHSVHPMTRNPRGVWSATVEGDLHGQYYSFRLRGPGLHADREVTDIYARGAQYPSGRSLILDLHETDPPGFDASAHRETPRPTDAIIYEMSVRDFTVAPDSGIAGKGLYTGLTEAGTHVPGDPSTLTGLDHLVELGITHVQLMPVQCFEADPGYNWGYMTVFFDTPEARYATTARGDARIRELKQAVDALHARGIGVVLDVVYNHTSPDATFEQLAPGYYFRMKSNGEFHNGSGCGNEMRTEHPMCRKFILDSLKFWVSEYGVDGFRFDLMGLMDLTTLQAIRDELRAIHPSILLYGEPWAAGTPGIRHVTDKHALRGQGIAAFNDGFRDALKGDTDGDQPGFAQTGVMADRIKIGLRGTIDDWALHPSEVINYCACHDNLTLWDKLAKTTPDETEETRKRMQKLVALLLLTAQGTPFLHSGQEFCRTKAGHPNTYNMPDEINQIDWSLKQDHRDVFEYYRGLIALRRAHPVFRLPTRESVEQRVHIMIDTPSPHCIAYALDGTGLPGESYSTTLILVNGDDVEHTFPIGPGRWLVVADHERVSPRALDEPSGSVTVPPHGGVIMHK